MSVVATAALGITSVATGAWFTDSATVTANSFTTGSVSLTATPATAALALPLMAPGDKVTAPITVTNDGTLALRYSVRSVTSGSVILPAQLDLTIKTGVATCTNAAFGVGGTVVYAAADLGSVAGINVIGDPTQGSQGGDRVLAAAGSEILCAQVELPFGSDPTFMSQTSTAILTFSAEQTTNNP